MRVAAENEVGAGPPAETPTVSLQTHARKLPDGFKRRIGITDVVITQVVGFRVNLKLVPIYTGCVSRSYT